MRRVYVLLLAMLLVLTGCAKQAKAKDISVKDGSYPYEIDHKKGAVELTVQDAAKSGILWRVEALPEDICAVSEEKAEKENTWRYRITGTTDGAARLTFTALQEDETVRFVLNLLVQVDEKGDVSVTDAYHQESAGESVEANGMKYTWNVDVDGILHFSFVNDEDRWTVSGEGKDVCVLSDMMQTPSGYSFSARAIAPGETTLTLTGETTQRQIQVVLRVDEAGKMTVDSVRE